MIKVFRVLFVLLMSSNANSTIITSEVFSGFGTSTILTTVDTELRVMTIEINGLGQFFQGSGELDFEIDTAFDSTYMERDNNILVAVDNILGQVLFRNGSSSPRQGYFAGTPEIAGPRVAEFSGLFAIAGTDGTFSKHDTYKFGIVYNDLVDFSGFTQSTLQINSVDYNFDVGNFTTVPIPSALILFFSGLLTLVCVKSNRLSHL